MRDRAGLSQQQLADRLQRLGLDASRDQVMNWERGRSAPGLSEWQAFMQVCQVKALFIPADVREVRNRHGFDHRLRFPLTLARHTDKGLAPSLLFGGQLPVHTVIEFQKEAENRCELDERRFRSCKKRGDTKRPNQKNPSH